MNKQALIHWLTTNCDCWSGDEEVLGNMSEAKLTLLKDSCQEATNNALVANAAISGFSHEGRDFRFDTATGGFVTRNADFPMEGADGSYEEDEEEDEEKEGENPMARNNYVPQRRPKNMQEWLKLAPPEALEVWNHNTAVHNAAKHDIIERLKAVADDTNDLRKQQLIANKLRQDMNLTELQELLVLVSPTANSEVARGANEFNYIGASTPSPAYGGLLGNTQTQADKEDFLPLPTINWADKE